MALRNRRVFELRVGKLGLSLLVGGISLLMFAFFLLGVFLGRHMDAYPERYAAGLMELVRGSFSTKTPVSPSSGSPGEGELVEEGEFGLTFYETLGGKGSGAKRRAKGLEEDRVAADSSEASPSNGAEKQTAEGMEGDHESALPAHQAPALDRGEQGQEKGRFEIQVAAYRERHKANDMAKKIAALGLSPRVVVKDLPGKGRWFRVIVNGFQDRKAAQEAGELISEKIPGLRVVIRSVSASQGGGD